MASLLANCFRSGKEHAVDYEPYSALDMGLSEEHGQVLVLQAEGRTVTLTLTDRGLVILSSVKGKYCAAVSGREVRHERVRAMLTCTCLAVGMQGRRRLWWCRISNSSEPKRPAGR